MEQRTEEWFKARCGKVTASRVADIIARTKTGYSTSRMNYMAELLTERLTGLPFEGFKSSAMQWGIDNEASARDAYAFRSNADVTEVGFVTHPSISDSGASPDGLVGDDGLVEIKCPNTATHVETLLGGFAGKYNVQMQWQMACTERKWCDFVSFDPRLPAKLQLFVYRVHRDDALIRELESAVTEFLGELDHKVKALMKLEM